MVRMLKGSLEAFSEYIRFHPDISYSLEPCDDGDFILRFNVKLKRHRLPCPTRRDLAAIFHWKGGTDYGQSEKDAS